MLKKALIMSPKDANPAATSARIEGTVPENSMRLYVTLAVALQKFLSFHVKTAPYIAVNASLKSKKKKLHLLKNRQKSN